MSSEPWKTCLDVCCPATAKRQDDVIKWKHFPRHWPFVRGIPWSPVNSPHKGQWRGALMFSLICACLNSWVSNRKAGDFETLLHPLWHHCNVFHPTMQNFSNWNNMGVMLMPPPNRLQSTKNVQFCLETTPGSGHSGSFFFLFYTDYDIAKLIELWME